MAVGNYWTSMLIMIGKFCTNVTQSYNIFCISLAYHPLTETFCHRNIQHFNYSTTLVHSSCCHTLSKLINTPHYFLNLTLTYHMHLFYDSFSLHKFMICWATVHICISIYNRISVQQVSFKCCLRGLTCFEGDLG